MGELPQYHIFQLARRIYGGKIAPKSKHLAEAVVVIKDGKYDEMLHELMNTDEKELRKIYEERELEPEITGEDWRPKDRKFLLEVES